MQIENKIGEITPPSRTPAIALNLLDIALPQRA